MHNMNDIIVGISTPYAKGAISIIRLSGCGSIELVNRIFKGKNLTKVLSHTVHYGYIMDKRKQEEIDEVLISVFRSPKTYTKEDVVEINCHGGIFVTNLIYELLVLEGARPAEPGEFTKRAFLNGRIDLTKAEAVMDMIDAENKNALRIANKGINGKIRSLVELFRERLLHLIAIINVNIDYPEYDDVEILTNEKLLPEIETLLQEMHLLLKQSLGAKYLKEGINTAIIGKPNVGKSTILNAILEEEKAIVTDIPGTTRDIIEAKVNIGNFTLNLIDTAGIRETQDKIEQIGIEKAKEKMAEAELVLFVLDSATKITKEEEQLFEIVKQKPHLVIFNKVDINQNKTMYFEEGIQISAKNKTDILKLEQEITRIITTDFGVQTDATYLSNARQVDKLNLTIQSLYEAKTSILNGAFIDFVELSLRDAYFHLGEITGDSATDSLINELFSKFCLGK